MTAVAKEYGVTRQAVYLCLKKAEKMRTPHAEGIDSVHESIGNGRNMVLDHETGLAVNHTVLHRMGDERATRFVQYHMDMLAMRQGADARNVDDLYRRFLAYLNYCAEHQIIPNNMNCYFALGINREQVYTWASGHGGTPRHKEFAEMMRQFFASVHEQGATDGVLNPISAMFWQKAHDGMVEASKLELSQADALGERRSAEDIAKTYADVHLPD